MCMGGGGDSAEIKETAADWANAEIAAAQWNRYQSVFKPFEKQWLADATMGAYNPGRAMPPDTRTRGAAVSSKHTLEAKQGILSGRTNADVAQAAASQLKPLNPFKGSALNPSVTTALGTTMGNANINANEAVKNLQIAGMQKAVDLGRGQANSAQLGMEGLAQTAAQNALNQSAINWENTANTAETFGSLAGTGATLGYNAYRSQQKKDKQDT